MLQNDIFQSELLIIVYKENLKSLFRQVSRILGSDPAQQLFVYY